MALYPLFSGNAGLIFGMSIVGLACFQSMGASFLTRKVKMLAAVLLVLSAMAQTVEWVDGMASTQPTRGFDLSAYYVAARLMSEEPRQSPYLARRGSDGRIVLSDRYNIYPDRHTPAYRYSVPFSVPFIYPPLTAILMKPMALLPFPLAYLLWNGLSLLAAIGAVLITLNLGGVRTTSRLALILGVGLFSYYPFQWDIIYGQVGCFVLLFVSASMWLLIKNRVLVSAMMFALATMIKLTPFVVFPVFIFRRQWKWLMSYALGLVALAGFSLWRGGWAVHEEFVFHVLPSLSCGTPICLNTSVVALVQEMFLGYVPNWWDVSTPLPRYACGVSRVIAALAYGLMMLRFWERRGGGDGVRDVTLALFLGISFSPISWWHHYTIAILPFLYLWCKMPEKGSRMLGLIVIVVGTNVVGFTQLLTSNAIASLVLSSILPLLTISFVYVSLDLSWE